MTEDLNRRIPNPWWKCAGLNTVITPCGSVIARYILKFIPAIQALTIFGR